jgi:hypothetical protein
MKFNWKLGLALLLGILSAEFAFKLAGWSYDPQRDSAVWWKLIVEYCSPGVAALFWWWLLKLGSQPRSRR